MNVSILSARTPSARPDAARSSSVLQHLWQQRQFVVLPLMFVAALVIFSVGAQGFMTVDNLTNVVRQSVYLLIVALGQLIVLIGGGLDLSVGGVMSLTSVLAATVMAMVYAAAPDAPWLAMLAGAGAGLLVGILAGAVNGLGATLLKIPSFMMTLGMGSVLFGITLYVAGGAPVYGLPSGLGEVFGFGQWLGIPVPAWVALLLIALVYGLLEWTRYGRHLYASGGNARAAQLSGVRTHRVLIASFMLSSSLAVVSGLLLTARMGTGEANVGESFPLDSIAACVIAGVSLGGGQGRALAVVVGTLLIMMVQNGLNLMQVGAYAETMVVGAILIVAMALARR